MKIHILTATDEEYNMVNELAEELKDKMALYKLQWKDVTLHKTGVGPSNTAEYLYRHKHLIKDEDIILNIGLAGYNGTPMTRLLQISSSINMDEDMRPLGGNNFSTPVFISVLNNSIKLGMCYSSASFVTKQLAEFRELPDNTICDMELNTIVSMLRNRIYSIKYISDTLDGGQYSDDLEQCISNFKEELLIKLPSIIKDIVK